MDDLISRQAAIDAVKSISDSICEQQAIDALCELPSIDAVPVVRCKDCKWCVEHYDTDENAPYWVCKNWDGGTDADGYCHEAERKES